MTGKVFSDSANIYQDQAKILFDYYKSAAEKIVAEEMELEQLGSEVGNAIAADEAALNKSKKLFPIVMIGSAVLLLLFFVLPLLVLIPIAGFVYGVKQFLDSKKYAQQIENGKIQLQQLQQSYQQIRRDYSVDKIGVTYVPVATRMPFEEKSFLIDHTNSVPETDFQLNVLHQPEEFQNSMTNLKKSMENIPIVETNEKSESINTSDYSVSVQNVTLHDYVGNIDRQVRNINYLLNDSENVSVSMPVIMPGSERANIIQEYATDEIGNHPVVCAFNVDFTREMEQFSSLNSLKNQMSGGEDSDSTEYMTKTMAQMAESVQLLSKTKNAGSSKLIQYTSDIFSTVLKAGYTQYSPKLEAEEIEKVRSTDFDYQSSVNGYTPFTMKKSSRVKYEMFSGNWIAEDGSTTTMPFGMHQIDEEILVPVITSLMEENRIERLKIYNNIEDQKREYLDKWSSEIGNYFRDNRKSADELITHMRETYADYVSASNMYQSLSDTTGLMKSTQNVDDAEVKEIDQQAEMIAGFELQAKQCNEQQERFAEFMDRIQESIGDTTNDFAHIEYYEGSLRDIASHETAVAMANLHELDQRRKQLVQVSPYLAAYGELPPEPKTSPEMIEHVQIDLEREVSEKLEEIETRKLNLSDSNTESER
ncbi:MAG: hypothetical protein II312_02710 [Lachnospiraceae bacterium]|nr:hypothetical protein [Lachnospiraceae bacterium]